MSDKNITFRLGAELKSTVLDLVKRVNDTPRDIPAADVTATDLYKRFIEEGARRLRVKLEERE